MNSGSATTTNAQRPHLRRRRLEQQRDRRRHGFTTRLDRFGNRTEDKSVTSTGSYNATATQNSSRWVMHMVAFNGPARRHAPPVGAHRPVRHGGLELADQPVLDPFH